ncbi:hypothetical protein HanIR_Chr12g0588821 [Helianthus annuus]|nr:hypothetical protein HanIR_Chr12g0588821 [Helianthus annuus]
MRSMLKSPTFVREKYPQWKIRTINFLNGHDQSLYGYIVRGPHIPCLNYMDFHPRMKLLKSLLHWFSKIENRTYPYERTFVVP